MCYNVYVGITNNQCVLESFYVDTTNNQCVLNNVYVDTNNNQCVLDTLVMLISTINMCSKLFMLIPPITNVFYNVYVDININIVLNLCWYHHNQCVLNCLCWYQHKQCVLFILNT